MSEKSTLAKAASILGITLCISLGLCGLNAFVAIDNPRWGQLLFVGGVIELAGIVLSLLGLLVVMLLAIAKSIVGKTSQKEDQQ